MDLSEAVLDTMRVLAPVLGDDIQVSLSTGATVPKVTVDRGQFGQILLNLALNARDAMPDGGGLTVSVRSATSSDLQRAGLSVADTSRRYVALAVEDTGAGMQPEVLQRVFEPFFTTKELGQGTGLGLATVYGLVHQNGGRIVASSEVGRGSAFTVLLPSRDAPAPPAVEGTGRRLVLVVEDQPAIRDLMGKILRRAGYDVVEAADGAEAASLIEDEDVRPEVIVSDVVMPNMGGGELRVRVRVVAPEVPFVFVSGHPLKSLDLPFLDPDLDRYLPKPFSPSALVNLLAEVLGERAESR